MAFVVLHAASVRRWEGKHNEFAADLKKHARARLPGFARPEWVVVVETLPVSISLVPTYRISSLCRKHRLERS